MSVVEKKRLSWSYILVAGIITAFWLFISSDDAYGVTAKGLLQKAEEIRNPDEDYRTRVTLEDKKPNGETVVRTYQTVVKGGEKTLVEFVTPTTDNGKKVLMVGNDMWFFTPKTKKPIRIAPRQRVAGNAVYGDIASLSFTDNYTAKIARKAKYKGKSVYVLDLVAVRGKPVTYEKIEYWIEAKTKRPVKAVYMTRSGKKMRVGYFEGYKNILGTVRPTALRIESKLKKGHVSTLKFSKQQQAKVPDTLFRKENLSRM